MQPHHGEMKSLSAMETKELLEKGRFGHLACSVGEEIYLVPITFVFEDGCIYSHSKLGKKIEMMRKNPHVCVQVEEVENFFRWKSAIAWGRFEELKGDMAAIAMRRLVQKVTEGENDRRRSDLEIDLAAQLESAIIYQIKIEKLSGQSEGFGH